MAWTKRLGWVMGMVIFVFDMDLNAYSMVWIESKCYKSFIYQNGSRVPCDEAFSWCASSWINSTVRARRPEPVPMVLRCCPSLQK